METVYVTEGQQSDGADSADSADAGTSDTPATPTLSEAEISSALAAVCGSISNWQEVSHPSLGTAYVGLSASATGGSVDACVGAVDSAGNTIFQTVVESRSEALTFANPAQDATGNVFVTYNPGRYNGVITLIPTSSGFADVGAGAYSNYDDGSNRYYYAELLGPGSDGRYQIQKSANDCNPSCAGGTTTTQVLSWDGNGYS